MTLSRRELAELLAPLAPLAALQRRFGRADRDDDFCVARHPTADIPALTLGDCRHAAAVLARFGVADAQDGPRSIGEIAPRMRLRARASGGFVVYGRQLMSVNRAGAILRDAAALVDGPRETSHGDKLANMEATGVLHDALDEAERIAAASGRKPLPRPVKAALRLALVKVARILCGDFNRDDYVDGAGYLACAGECAQRDADRARAGWSVTAALRQSLETPAFASGSGAAPRDEGGERP